MKRRVFYTIAGFALCAALFALMAPTNATDGKTKLDTGETVPVVAPNVTYNMDEASTWRAVDLWKQGYTEGRHLVMNESQFNGENRIVLTWEEE
jgi:hypothetical protein